VSTLRWLEDDKAEGVDFGTLTSIMGQRGLTDTGMRRIHAVYDSRVTNCFDTVIYTWRRRTDIRLYFRVLNHTDSNHRAGGTVALQASRAGRTQGRHTMIVFKVGDRVTVSRSFGVYEAGECGTVVGQLRPYIHVALDNSHQKFGDQREHKAVSTLFQSDELVKITM
jgi:hypothetical protein